MDQTRSGGPGLGKFGCGIIGFLLVLAGSVLRLYIEQALPAIRPEDATPGRTALAVAWFALVVIGGVLSAVGISFKKQRSLGSTLGLLGLLLALGVLIWVFGRVFVW